MTDSLSAIREALEPVATILQADGYELEVTGTEPSVSLQVIATPEACADCLVGKDVFAAIARHYLEDCGLHPQLQIEYPDTTSEHA